MKFATKSSTRGMFRIAHNHLVGYMARAGLLLTAIPMTVDAIDAIPEAQRGLYKESNGKFVLDVDGYEDPVGLKSALTKEREAAKNASKQVAAWAALGKTPEEIQALVEAAAQAEQDKLGKSGEWDKLKQQMADQHKAELGKKDERINVLTKSLERRLIDADATAAIAAAKGVPMLLLPHVRASVKVIEDGGDFKVQVVDAAGNPRVNGKGEFLSIADLVGEMRQSEVFGRAFEASGTTGGGASGGPGGGSKVIKQAAFDALSPKDRAARMKDGYSVVE
ncbi:hypothetical protein [Variovorax sp. UMC13]|uniref:hypothetical protein n=1 Tax=Variovorax sp. UMC13 TaxID=1862326 RepID=UPI0016037976|nr:hypothetical protein [Variovorax sp. UMC13]MBB1599488.1 hypothetical protein [Variovorax sp. UMC13]